MAEVKVIVEGFINADCRAKGLPEKTRTTSTLVTDGELKILADPGIYDDPAVLIDALKAEGLTPDKITHIFLTHSHIDHYYSVALFPKAKVLEFYALWQGAEDMDRPNSLSPDISLIESPGHSINSLTMLVDTPSGKVAIAGDVWWKENYPDNDPYADDMQQLLKTRVTVLKLADYIIPGHGKMFKSGRQGIK